ncbi:hypothetical protein VaNZ11_017043 [Volvox africanus]|uniref:PPM-type phosphatase domain-containing protein n=1 Tax=Volvox africanus TaxID=51714 RepID=A0ABQ5SQJ2_9CHLO|nr:hypothetical protein VaNZ11_017043 [Volvox africanus]
MFSLSGNTKLPGQHGIGLQEHLVRHTCFVGRPFRAVAVVPNYGRRRLYVLATKFTVNTNQSNTHQVVQIIPTGSAPRIQSGAYGLLPALAGGLVALTGLVTLIRSVLQKRTYVATDAGADNQAIGGQAAGSASSPSGRTAEPRASDADVTPGVQKLYEAQQQSGQGRVVEPAAGDEGNALQWQQGMLELEQTRARQSTSELQRELQDAELELLRVQQERVTRVTGARVELKESRRKAELLEAMVGALRERLRREEDRNAALEEEIESGRAEMARFAQQRQEMQERVDSLRMELADTQAKLLVAQARAAELDARLAHLVVQNKKLELRVGELEAQLQARTVTVASAASAAEDKLQLMQAAADADRLLIAKLQGKLAEREAQLTLLRDGESELQEVLERSKAAAAQMSELLRQRDSELLRLQEALRAAEDRRLEQEKALNAQVAVLQQEREPVLLRLKQTIKEAEARRLEEAAAMKKKLEELQKLHEEQLHQLRVAGGEAGLAAQAEVAALKAQLSGLQSERDREVALLNSQLQESAQHAEQLREAAKAQAATQQAEVKVLQEELETAKIRAEQSSARRVAEVSELRSALEQQLEIARQEALDARTQLATVKEQLDGVLSQEFLQLLEEELRRSILPGTGTQPTARVTSSGSPLTEQELRDLDSREAALRHQLESLSAELAELQSGAVSRMGPALVARAQELEGAVAQSRKALRAREVVGDQQGIQRITQHLSTVNSELAALYRSVMLPAARSRERVVRLEMQDREVELRGVVEQQIRVQDRLDQERREAEQRREKAVAAASGPTQQQLRRAVQSRVKELLQEREQQAQHQAAAREKQLQAQLRAAQAGSVTQQRELRAVQEAVEKQARLMEESWKLQLETSSRALQEAAVDKQRLAAEVNRSTEQVQRQLAELESLRRELLAARSMVTTLRRAAEDSRATVAQQSVGAAQEVQRLAAQVQQLQSALRERERQYAASSKAPALPQQAITIRGTPSMRQPATTAAVAPTAQLPAAIETNAAPARVPPMSDGIVRRKSADLVKPKDTSAPGVGFHDHAGSGGVAQDGSSTADALQSKVPTAANGDGGFKPLTPLRPGWPVQYGGTESAPPTQLAAAGGEAMATETPVPVPGSAKGSCTGYSKGTEEGGADGNVRNNSNGIITVRAPPAGNAAQGPGPLTGPPQLSANRVGTSNGASVSNDNRTGSSNTPNGIQAASSPPAAAIQKTVSPSSTPQQLAQLKQPTPVGGIKTSRAQSRSQPAEELAASTSSQSAVPGPAINASSATSRRQGHHELPPSSPVPSDVGSVMDAETVRVATRQGSGAFPEDGQGGQDADAKGGKESQIGSVGSEPSTSSLASADGSAARAGQIEASTQEDGSLAKAGADTKDALTTAGGRSPVQLKQQQDQTPRGVRSQASRRSVPPGPFNSTPLPVTATGNSLPSAAVTSIGDAQVQPQQPQQPQQPREEGNITTSEDTNPAGGATTSSDATSSSASSSASSSRSSVSHAIMSSNTTSVPPPASTTALSGAFINPTTTQSVSQPPGFAIPSPPPIEPLTPLKVPAPADFTDFKRTIPGPPAGATNSGAVAASPSGSPAAPKVPSPSEPKATQRQASQAPSPPLATPSGTASVPASAQGSRSSSQRAKPKTPQPQSPAAAAMAAATGAAEAARRAAAAAVSVAPSSKPPGFNTPPIAEWGRPKPQQDAADGTDQNAVASGGASRLRESGSENSSVTSKPAEEGGTSFFSDAELGAEIAAIAQSLVQRTIGGGARSQQPSPPEPQASSTASQRPSVSPEAAERGSMPEAAGVQPATVTSAAAATAAIRLSSASMAAALSGPATGPARRLQLSVAAYGVPHVAKAEKGSEDAYFMVTPSGGVVTSSGGGGRGGVSAGRSAPGGALAGVSVLGVADGVGGWVEANVDPGQYSREVVDAAARAAEEIGPGADPRQLLAEAQAAVRTIGSCTACVAVLGEKAPASADKGPGGQVLSIANLGDSGCRVVRRASLVLATSAQEHQFNMPYQMAHPDNLPDTDTAADAQMYQLALEPGDVIVLATDGLFDNMWDEELVSMVAAAAASIPPGLAGPAAAAAAQSAAQQLSSSLVAAAFRHAQDPGFRSPWAVELANQPAASWISRLFPRGGKMDDITAVVAIVTTA